MEKEHFRMKSNQDIHVNLADFAPKKRCGQED
jgi:hypothetical protein